MNSLTPAARPCPTPTHDTATQIHSGSAYLHILEAHQPPLAVFQVFLQVHRHAQGMEV